MAKFFKRFQKRTDDRSRDERRRPVSGKSEDLMDPVLYQGGLDKEKYPVLPQEKDRKPKEEPENPLNKR